MYKKLQPFIVYVVFTVQQNKSHTIIFQLWICKMPENKRKFVCTLPRPCLLSQKEEKSSVMERATENALKELQFRCFYLSHL